MLHEESSNISGIEPPPRRPIVRRAQHSTAIASELLALRGELLQTEQLLILAKRICITALI